MSEDLKGLGLAEEVDMLALALRNGDWSGGLVSGVGAGIDALGYIANPSRALLSSGIAWLLEHVSVLTDALDQFAGDPGAIKSYANDWRQTGLDILTTSGDMRTYVSADTADWHGQTADNYRVHAGVQSDGIEAAASSATSMGDAVELAGDVVGVVRLLVRDLIADCVAEILLHVPAWLALEGVSLGIGTPAVIADAVALIAKWV